MRGDVLLWPDTFLTKICIVSASEAVELMLEALDVRRIVKERVVGSVVELEAKLEGGELRTQSMR